MKVQIISDVHLEFGNPYDWIDRDSGDVIIIAGDLTNSFEGSYCVLNYLADYYRHVIFTPGNHEYYSFDKSKKLSCKENVHVLDNGVCTIDGLKFLGTTLWTDFNNNKSNIIHCERNISDFLDIPIMSPQEMVRKYVEAVEFIKSHKADVIVTHFAPHLRCSSSNNKLSSYFATNLTNLMLEQKPRYWIYGHTHYSMCYQEPTSQCWILSNQVGYPGEKQPGSFYEPIKTIDIK